MKFDVVIADPPWKYQNQGRGAAENHYECMSDQEIYALGPLVQEIMAPTAILLLWATWPKMPECFRTMSEWGAPYKTCAFMWYKTMKTQPGFKMNGGSYTRSNSEPCLLGRPRGKALERSSRAVRQVIHEEVASCDECDGTGCVLSILIQDGERHKVVQCHKCAGLGCIDPDIPPTQSIEEPITRHSKKPEEFYRRVQELYAGKRIVELFSRTPRPGIRALGNEIDGTDIRVSLEQLARKRR